MSLHDDLKAIQASDPDGGEREPDKYDYAAHEMWARQTFGDATWDTYRRGGWGREPGYHAEGGDDEQTYDADGRL